MSRVRRTGETVQVTLDRQEAALLRQLVSDVREMLAAARPPTDPWEDLVGGSGPTAAPDDPVLFRLLPDGYDEDAEAAGELRRLTEASLRKDKSETATRVLDSLPPEGGRLRLDLPTAEAWLRALNDVRLALGTRLDVTEETGDEFAAGSYDGDDPVSMAHQVYAWLSGLQDLLVTALLAGLDDERHEPPGR